MNSDSNYDCRISSFAEYLDCDPKIVYDLYHEIDLDRISDLEKVTELKKTKQIYEITLKQTKAAYLALNRLPDFEKGILELSSPELITNMATSVEELSGLLASRTRIIELSDSVGGRNIKADVIAELVARIFLKMKRRITFGISGQNDNVEPSTDFCRAVREALNIFRILDKPAYQKQQPISKTEINLGRRTFRPVEMDKKLKVERLANWRQPAHRAWQKHTNTN